MPQAAVPINYFPARGRKFSLEEKIGDRNSRFNQLPPRKGTKTYSLMRKPQLACRFNKFLPRKGT
jgi:hypothetical protein